jgi:signal transduction histidine kinase
MNAKSPCTPIDASRTTPVAMPLAAVREPNDLDARNHAIKNCAAVILGLAQTLERHVDPLARSRVAQLVDASRRMAKLVAPAARPCELALEDVGVEELLRPVVDRLASLAETRTVRLAVDCGGGQVVGDCAELAEALFNVAANAIQASPPNSTVRISTRRSHAGDHEWVVEDSGCGIAPSLLPRLGTVGVTTRREGSGLGLALALQAISRHRGNLYVESPRVEGRGTTMTIWLPAVPGR